VVGKFFRIFQKHIFQYCYFDSDIMLVDAKQYNPDGWFSLQKIQLSKVFIIGDNDSVFIKCQP